jgi:hypothetical protein
VSTSIVDDQKRSPMSRWRDHRTSKKIIGLDVVTDERDVLMPEALRLAERSTFLVETS